MKMSLIRQAETDVKARIGNLVQKKAEFSKLHQKEHNDAEKLHQAIISTRNAMIKTADDLLEEAGCLASDRFRQFHALQQQCDEQLDVLRALQASPIPDDKNGLEHALASCENVLANMEATIHSKVAVEDQSCGELTQLDYKQANAHSRIRSWCALSSQVVEHLQSESLSGSVFEEKELDQPPASSKRRPQRKRQKSDAHGSFARPALHWASDVDWKSDGLSLIADKSRDTRKYCHEHACRYRCSR